MASAGGSRDGAGGAVVSVDHTALLLDCWQQFAYRGNDGRGPFLYTGGLSTLEQLEECLCDCWTTTSKHRPGCCLGPYQPLDHPVGRLDALADSAATGMGEE